MRRWWFKGILIGILLLLSGCSSFADQDQVSVSSDLDVWLEPGRAVGQTFVARHGGLEGVAFWLEPEPGTQGTLLLHLRTDLQAEEDLVTASLPLSEIITPGFYRFTFSPLPDTTGKYYYAFVELQGEGRVQVGSALGDTYLDGALHVNHQPWDSQTAFALVYDPYWLALDVAKAALVGVGLLVLAALLYVVPGWALLAWLWRGKALTWAETLSLAIGLSVGLYPLLFLWTDLLGLHMGPLYAWIPILGGLTALVWRYRHWRPAKGKAALRAWLHSENLLPDLTLILILFLTFGVRLLTVRTLDAPMWGDSYQHTMIVQLLLDAGGLFDSWEPYAPLTTFTYHFGFHSNVAAFSWLTGMPAIKAVIWVGQLLNGMAALSLYALAMRVSRSRWAGTAAVLIAGLLSPMPMFYVNWGRYTQLAGQVILPAAVVITWAALEALHPDKRLLLLSWITGGGLALSHYRVLIFYVVFVFAWFFLEFARQGWKKVCARVVHVGMGGALLFLPWLIHVYGGTIVRVFFQELGTPPAQLSDFERGSNAIGDILQYLPSFLWIFIVISVAIGFWKHRRTILLLSAWWFLLFVVTNPDWVHLPGSGIVSNFALFISAYIPASILIGDLFSSWIVYLKIKRGLRPLVGFILVVFGLFGAKIRLGELKISQHALVTRPDIRAMSWISENVSPQSLFVVNSFPAYGGTLVVGSDGGWWLPLLSKRDSVLPPLTYAMEVGLQEGYLHQVNTLTKQLEMFPLDDLTTLSFLRACGITHVYIGQQQGRVNYSGPNILDPTVLQSSPYYKVLYHRDRVWIFEVDYEGLF